MGPETSPTAVCAQLQQQLSSWGLDIVHPFTPQLFNAHCPADNALPTFGRTTTAALLVGNSRQLWDPFLRHLAAHPEQLEAANPLDDYIQTAMAASLAACGLTLVPESPHHTTSCSTAPQAGSCPPAPSTSSSAWQHQHQDHQQQQQQQQQQQGVAGTRCHVRYSHSSGALFVNVLRVAELSRLAYYSPVTHLCLHPVHGPWFALRAVVLLDLEAGREWLAAAPPPCFPGVDPAGGNQQQQQQQEEREEEEEDQLQQQQPQPQPHHQQQQEQHVQQEQQSQQQAQEQQESFPDPLPCPYPALEEEAGVAMASLKAAGGLATWKQHWREWAGLRRMAGRYVGGA
jgi:methylmalonic aciduria homocystinuria type C protein